jgi:hypothetical protein
MELLDRLTTPYDPKKYHYYLRGQTEKGVEYTLDLFHMGFAFASPALRDFKYYTKEQAWQKVKDMGLEGRMTLRMNPPFRDQGFLTPSHARR